MKSLVKNNPVLPEFPSIFDDFLLRDLFHFPSSRSNGSSVPSVNIRETDRSYEIEVAAPGMKKEDFKVELDGQLLTISGEREMKNEEHDEKQRYTRREFSYSSFKRSFTLPERMVEPDKISARYTDGILHLSVPKSKEAEKITRLISVE